MAYSWEPNEPMTLLGINIPNRKEIYLTCPFCGGKRFGYNTIKGIGHCWSCEQSADAVKYYALSTGLSLYEARKDIEQRLGITNVNGNVERSTLPERVVYNQEVKEAEKASPEVLDDTYRAFLAELQLSEKNWAMLKARGLSDEEIIAREYKTFPSLSEINYFDLCRRLQADGHSLKGVPGFFKTKKGDYTFVQITKGIIMPYRNHRDQIVGLQIRKDDDLRSYIDELQDYEAKCSWFSSKNKEGGCGATAGVHYACDFRYDGGKKEWLPVFDEGFVLTEGIMKGDITHSLMSNCPVIAVPGVHATKELRTELLRLKEWGVTFIRVCLDMDYHTNKNVEQAMDKIKATLTELGFEFAITEWEVNVEVNGVTKPLLKGIDDYLAYCQFEIIPTVLSKE